LIAGKGEGQQGFDFGLEVIKPVGIYRKALFYRQNDGISEQFRKCIDYAWS
jgi:hypothetical protein